MYVLRSLWSCFLCRYSRCELGSGIAIEKAFKFFVYWIGVLQWSCMLERILFFTSRSVGWLEVQDTSCSIIFLFNSLLQCKRIKTFLTFNARGNSPLCWGRRISILQCDWQRCQGLWSITGKSLIYGKENVPHSTRLSARSVCLQGSGRLQLRISSDDWFDKQYNSGANGFLFDSLEQSEDIK